MSTVLFRSKKEDMIMQVSIKETKSILTKSKLPDAEFVINPYLGCPHGCIYCYAEFMKRFSQHTEQWGSFLEVKHFTGEIDFHQVSPQNTILIGSVTDAYNPYEAKYCVTRDILSRLSNCVARVEILTKSKLVCRDIELLRMIPNIAVGISLNTTDDIFRQKIEPFASSVEDRIETIKTLHKAGISTYMFISPFFPEITDYQNILQKVNGYIDYVCFENLNLRGSYQSRVLSMVFQEYPEKRTLFEKTYLEKDQTYWCKVESEIRQHCNSLLLPYRIYFHHGSIKKSAEKR